MMHRKFTGNNLIIATHNKGKVREIKDMLGAYIPVLQTVGELNLPEPEETGCTFIENASIKALAAARASKIPALADDSGLWVYALNGDPGIDSAGWAGPSKDFNMAMSLVHEKLGDHPDRSAAFICALVLAWPDGHVESFEGRIEGNLIWPPRGDKGFGYDPFFVPGTDNRTYGEIESSEKHATSHRARAFEKMVQACFSNI
jgi:non-canonical purine NTP pyrophosphatase (RdgB/HAM1 family)